MTVGELVIDHDVDLSPVVVWDALTDPVLVDGWLGEARIDARPGGAYRVSWVGRPGADGVDGVIIDHDPPRLLSVRTDAGGFSITLDARPGGSRGDWTRMRLTATSESAASARENWLVALEQLDELLRGHPVDWALVDAPLRDPRPPEGLDSRDTGTTHAGDPRPITRTGDAR